jgi:hypothetical protein
MARTLTLKEVGQQFYKNPAFPMVPSVEDIRRAIFETLTGPDHYEVIDGNGEALAIGSADDLSIGSMDLSLRKATSGITAPETTGAGSGPTEGGGTGGRAGGGEGGDRARDYRRFVLEVPNRSLVDVDARRALANLLQAVLDTVDPDTGGDVQLLDLQLNITAVLAAVGGLEQRAAAAGATWEEQQLDF